MQYARSVFSKKSPKKGTQPTPYLGNLNFLIDVKPDPTGYDRADWFAQSAAYQCSAPINARGIDGPLRECFATDRGNRIEMTYADPYTLQPNAVEQIWERQLKLSDGLNTPGRDEAYTAQDTPTLWA